MRGCVVVELECLQLLSRALALFLRALVVLIASVCNPVLCDPHRLLGR